MDQQEALRKLQAEELSVLLAIGEFCERNDITWFMMSGTALGAARHQGFIPWDDDIDIGMLRADYDKFVSLAKAGLPEGCSLHTPENTTGFAPLFAKVFKDGTLFQTQETLDSGLDQGIFVDVFPFDRVPKDERACAATMRSAALWQRASYLYHSGAISVPHRGALGMAERAACRVAHGIARLLLTPEKIKSRFERLIDRTPVQDGDCLITLSWPYMRPVGTELLVPTSVAVFEGHELPAPALVEKYLENEYGNWRELPAPENRRTHLPQRLVFSDGSEWAASAGA